MSKEEGTELLKNQAEFVAYEIIAIAGPNFHRIRTILSNVKMVEHPTIRLAIKFSAAISSGNFTKFFQLFKLTLSTKEYLIACIAASRL